MTNDNNHKINQLIKLTHKLGGRIRNVKKQVFDLLFYNNEKIDGNFSIAPFTGANEDLGVDWKNKIIYFCDSKKPIHWGGILHEMGHIFCSTKIPVLSEEFNFLGWEYFIARKLKGVNDWFSYNSDYVITTDDKSFSHYLFTITDKYKKDNRKDLYKILYNRIDYAKKNRMIINNKPVSLR